MRVEAVLHFCLHHRLVKGAVEIISEPSFEHCVLEMPQ